MGTGGLMLKIVDLPELLQTSQTSQMVARYYYYYYFTTYNGVLG